MNSTNDRRSWIWPVLVIILSCGLMWKLWGERIVFPSPYDAVPRPITPRGDLTEEEKTITTLFKNTSPSVVHITTLTVQKRGFAMDATQVPQGTGTGFFWDEQGHIVTNYHVIQEADAAQVTLADQSTYKAKLVGAYPDRDLAVLSIEAPKDKLRPIPIGTSHDLMVGQRVLAIGNPFGLDQSLTTGIISALGRQMDSANRRTIRDVIQTDAAINPGNSGGPLLDSAGRLIGVNTAIFSPSGASAGIGFAIPVDEVNRVVPQLIKNGKVSRAGLGVQIAPDSVARRMNIDGVIIVDVVANSPAANAGLRPTTQDEENRIRLGDIIVAIDGKSVKTSNELLDAFENHKAGDTVDVTILRDKKKENVEVKLTALK